MTVGWRAQQSSETSYTGFVHLLDQDGRIVAEDDHVPQQGRRPTNAWLSGEVIEDTYELRLAILRRAATASSSASTTPTCPGLPRLGAAEVGEITVQPSTP